MISLVQQQLRVMASYNNKSYYLYTGKWYWLGSPFNFESDCTAVFMVDKDSLTYDFFFQDQGVRGVVSLSSDAKLLGSGTYDDVYIVE